MTTDSSEEPERESRSRRLRRSALGLIRGQIIKFAIGQAKTRLLSQFVQQHAAQAALVVTSVAVTLTTVYTVNNFTTVLGDDTGWEVVDSETRTTLDATVGNDVVFTSISGGLLRMGGSLCDETSAVGAGRLCFDSVDGRFKVSENQGEYVDLEGRAGPPGSPGRAGSGGKARTAGLTRRGRAAGQGWT